MSLFAKKCECAERLEALEKKLQTLTDRYDKFFDVMVGELGFEAAEDVCSDGWPFSSLRFGPVSPRKIHEQVIPGKCEVVRTKRVKR